MKKIKNICYVPWQGTLKNDIVFSTNKNGWEYNLKKILQKSNIRIHTNDVLAIKDADACLMFDNIFYKNLDAMWEMYNNKLLHKTVYIDYEPPTGHCKNHSKEGLIQLSKIFNKIITYDDTIIDNKKFIKGNIANFYSKELKYKNDFNKRKLVCMITNDTKNENIIYLKNHYNTSCYYNEDNTPVHPNSAYKKREEIAEFFQTKCPTDFDIYGALWDPKFSNVCKGPIDRDQKTIINNKYKFAITFDSYINQSGYISEKIFDAFHAKVVPIYLGADNVNEYIPQECFINLKDFNSYEELYLFLLKIDEKAYQKYIRSIEKFLNSDMYKKNFSSKRSAEIIAKSLLSENSDFSYEKAYEELTKLQFEKDKINQFKSLKYYFLSLSKNGSEMVVVFYNHEYGNKKSIKYEFYVNGKKLNIKNIVVKEEYKEERTERVFICSIFNIFDTAEITARYYDGKTWKNAYFEKDIYQKFTKAKSFLSDDSKVINYRRVVIPPKKPGVISVLEVNNIDILGKRYNGYDLLGFLNGLKNFEAKQAVLYKSSNNEDVFEILNSQQIYLYQSLEKEEKNILSVHNVLSITSQSLMESDEYERCDIVHIHLLHNSKLSLYSLIDIAKEKKLIISLHDPWWVSGRCVHHYDCQKWQNGCGNCQFLNTAFEMGFDNTESMWNLKKKIFECIDCDLIVSSKYMEDIVKKSQILKNQKCHRIPFGLDLNKFKPVEDKKKLRKKYNIPEKNIVYFLRAQDEFKGTKYVDEAFNILKNKKDITIITCNSKGLLKSCYDKFDILEMGMIKSEEILIEMYQVSDVFLMPSLGESFGFMAIEAMACGIPVVVFNNSALPSITFAPECGVLVENKNSEKLSQAIEMLNSSPSDRKKRGKLGRKLAIQNYDLNNYNNQIKKLYEETYKKKTCFVKEYPSSPSTTDIKYLNKRLNVIAKNLNMKGDLEFIKDQVFIDNSKHGIDYSNKEVLETIKKFNKRILTKCYIDKRHPIKTAISLLKYDRKKFVETAIKKFKGEK